jgi:hypothetical protein
MLLDAVAEERDVEVEEFGVSIPTAEMMMTPKPETAAQSTAGIQTMCQKITSGLIRAGGEVLKAKITLTTAPFPASTFRSVLGHAEYKCAHDSRILAECRTLRAREKQT